MTNPERAEQAEKERDHWRGESEALHARQVKFHDLWKAAEKERDEQRARAERLEAVKDAIAHGQAVFLGRLGLHNLDQAADRISALEAESRRHAGILETDIEGWKRQNELLRRKVNDCKARADLAEENAGQAAMAYAQRIAALEKLINETVERIQWALCTERYGRLRSVCTKLRAALDAKQQEKPCPSSESDLSSSKPSSAPNLRLSPPSKATCEPTSETGSSPASGASGTHVSRTSSRQRMSQSSSRWRPGRTSGRTLYRDEQSVGRCDTPEVAREVCDGMNEIQQLSEDVRVLALCLEYAPRLSDGDKMNLRAIVERRKP